MRIALFTPFLYPFHIDMLATLNERAKAKIFTCGVFGNYPFKELLRHAELLRSFNILGNIMIEPISLMKFLSWRPRATIIFGIEGIAGLTIYFVSKLIGARTLVIVEENNVTLFNNAILDFIQRLKRSVTRFVYRSSDVLVAESSASKNYVLGMLRVYREKPVFVHPHGVNIERFSKARSISRRKAKELIVNEFDLFGDLVRKMWISFIGELSYCKGADVLIDAISILEERGILRECVFLLPKSNFLRDKADLKDIYMRKLYRLLTSKAVVLYPLMRSDYMPIFYRASDVVVLPSRLLRHTSSDRSPNVALEALASGSLLIASCVGGIPDIVGDAGIPVKPNDPHALAAKLCQVLNGYEKYRHLEEKARERAVNKLDIRLYSRTLLELLLKSY